MALRSQFGSAPFSTLSFVRRHGDLDENSCFSYFERYSTSSLIAVNDAVLCCESKDALLLC